MKSGERRNIIIPLVATIISLTGAAILMYLNPLYFIFFVVSFFISLTSGKETMEKLAHFFIYLIYGFAIILIIDLCLLSYILQKPFNELSSFIFTSVLWLVTFLPIKAKLENYLEKIKAVSFIQKTSGSLISKFPDLICDMHYTRTVEKSFLGYKIIRCRTSKKCFSLGRIVHARLLVGVIGDYRFSRLFEGEYSTMTWNNKTRTIFEGDYDVIEIREGEEIEDYDRAVTKVIAFLYNQIKRHKPVDEIVIRVAGNPPLSESTKRLLEERFLRVDYLELNYKKLNYTL